MCKKTSFKVVYLIQLPLLHLNDQPIRKGNEWVSREISHAFLLEGARASTGYIRLHLTYITALSRPTLACKMTRMVEYIAPTPKSSLTRPCTRARSMFATCRPKIGRVSYIPRRTIQYTVYYGENVMYYGTILITLQ